MTDDIWKKLDQNVINRFLRECNQRDESADDALERVLIDYIRGEDHASKIADIHDSTVSDETPVLVEGTTGQEIDLLEQYDPRDSGYLTEEAFKQLTDLEEPVAINPSHVTDEALPQKTQIKTELIKGIVRHEYPIVKKYHLKTITKQLLDIGRGYQQREYIDPIWNDITVLEGSDVTTTFLSDSETVLDWIDEQLAERGAQAEYDIYWVASELYHSDVDVSVEALNRRLEQLSLSVDQLHSPE